VRQVRRSSFLWLTIGVAAFLALCSGCGGGSGNNAPPPVTTLTAAQDTAVATQIEGTFVAASALMGTDMCGNPYAPTEDFFCTIPVSSIQTCMGGGTVAVAGSLTGDLDWSDTGDVTALITMTPTNCSIPGSTLVMNGESTITVSGTGLEFYGGLSSFTVTEVGSISYGPKPTGVCPVNLTIAASFIGNAEHTTRACTLTGTACGQTINQSCM